MFYSIISTPFFWRPLKLPVWSEPLLCARPKFWPGHFLYVWQIPHPQQVPQWMDSFSLAQSHPTPHHINWNSEPRHPLQFILPQILYPFPSKRLTNSVFEMSDESVLSSSSHHTTPHGIIVTSNFLTSSPFHTSGGDSAYCLCAVCKGSLGNVCAWRGSVILSITMTVILLVTRGSSQEC